MDEVGRYWVEFDEWLKKQPEGTKGSYSQWLENEVRKFRQAIGLMTTALPNMVMDPNDPIAMAQQVVDEVEELRGELTWCSAAPAFQPPDGAPGGMPAGQARLGWLRGPAKLLWGEEKAKAQIAHEFPDEVEE